MGNIYDTFPGMVYSKRVVCAVGTSAGQLNHASGVEILPALSGRKYRLLNWAIQASGGGTVSVATGIYINGTQSSSSVHLVAIAAAALTLAAVNTPATANNTVLGSGATFAPCDAATNIVAIKNGSDIATATSIDVTLYYSIE